MLKIKDDVDLNELKKFGFSSEWGDNFSWSYNSIWVGIAYGTRGLMIDIPDWDLRDGIEVLSELIYDLTAANLLEKG